MGAGPGGKAVPKRAFYFYALILASFIHTAAGSWSYACESASPLTMEKRKNAQYDLRCGRVKLQDGNYAFGKDSPFHSVELTDKMAWGDLNGDGVPDAAIILRTFAGASGVLVEMVAVLNENGSPRQAAAAMLGNKVGVETLSIQSGEIVMYINKHAKDDPLCCPSRWVTEKYTLQGCRLAPVP